MRFGLPIPDGGALFLDPGRRVLAWSAWGLRELVRCGLARVDKGGVAQTAQELAKQVPHGPDVCILEEMVYYVEGRKDTKQAEMAKTADLLELQLIGAYVCGVTHPKVFHIVPARTWKGQVPKEVTEERVPRMLNAEERAVYYAALESTPKKLRHNITDAVGLGCWYFGRKLQPRGTP